MSSYFWVVRPASSHQPVFKRSFSFMACWLYHLKLAAHSWIWTLMACISTEPYSRIAAISLGTNSGVYRTFYTFISFMRGQTNMINGSFCDPRTRLTGGLKCTLLPNYQVWPAISQPVQTDLDIASGTQASPHWALHLTGPKVSLLLGLDWMELKGRDQVTNSLTAITIITVGVVNCFFCFLFFFMT